MPPYELVIGEEDTDYSNNTKYISFKATRLGSLINSYSVAVAPFKYYKSLKRIVIGESFYCFAIHTNSDDTVDSSRYTRDLTSDQIDYIYGEK